MKSNFVFKRNLIMVYTAIALANMTQIAFAEGVPAKDEPEAEYTFMDLSLIHI